MKKEIVSFAAGFIVGFNFKWFIHLIYLSVIVGLIIHYHH